MSVSGFEHEYVYEGPGRSVHGLSGATGASGFEHGYVYEGVGQPIHARRQGVYASIGIGGAALVVLFGFLIFGKPKTEATPAPAAAPTKVSAIDALASAPAASAPIAFELNAPEFAKAAKTVTQGALEQTGGQWDSLTLGEFGATAPYIRFDVRQSAEKRTNPDFFLDLTRHAADAGLKVLKIGAPAPFATRFGTFEYGEIRLGLVDANGATAGERVCQAMRLAGAKQGVEIAGVICGVGGKLLDRRALPCLVDQLDYRPGADKGALTKFFQANEAPRAKACGTATAGDSEKSDWFEAHSAAPARSAPVAKHAKKAQ
jgi:hypothetical protein